MKRTYRACERQRIVRQRKLEISPPLFPGYCFIVAVPQWHVAHYSPGVRRLILDGGRPASVADGIVAAIRSRERNGLVELPKPPRFKRGDAVRILKGPFAHSTTA
jgi:transcription antitermination factor NusG